MRGEDPPMPMGGPGGGHQGHGHAHDDDDDDDDEDQQPQNFFAGGERSALSVEGPGRQRPGNSTVRDILRKAAQATQDRMGGLGGGGQPDGPSAFGGGGHTLGSDDVDSSFIPDPNAPQPEAEETAIRQITFWRDGFSVQDGPLMRYDDPANARLLDDINTGHAPPAILNVQVGQPVELRVVRRLDEEYVAAPSNTTFGGTGNRLGAPVPGDAAPAAAQPALSHPLVEGTRIPITPTFELDLSEPTTSVQLRLADGTRMTVRLNLTHTISDLRNYINAHQRGFAGRAYTLSTTFPTKPLENLDQTIKDAGVANSVVVHRWAE
ncbi:SEP-domain-containing protein [Auriculariales sp. MPI-PUGE-AT-0066]|nr:SEP-domain-containing protein [Auriculariales sp. MPI-PUGE-AT-0066]